MPLDWKYCCNQARSHGAQMPCDHPSLRTTTPRILPLSGPFFMREQCVHCTWMHSWSSARAMRRAYLPPVSPGSTRMSGTDLPLPEANLPSAAWLGLPPLRAISARHVRNALSCLAVADMSIGQSFSSSRTLGSWGIGTCDISGNGPLPKRARIRVISSGNTSAGPAVPLAACKRARSASYACMASGPAAWIAVGYVCCRGCSGWLMMCLRFHTAYLTRLPRHRCHPGWLGHLVVAPRHHPAHCESALMIPLDLLAFRPPGCHPASAPCRQHHHRHTSRLPQQPSRICPLALPDSPLAPCPVSSSAMHQCSY